MEIVLYDSEMNEEFAFFLPDVCSLSWIIRFTYYPNQPQQNLDAEGSRKGHGLSDNWIHHQQQYYVTY